MKQKKKRDKKYKPKIKVYPLGIREHYKVEIPLFVALECLGTDKLSEEQLTFLASFAAVCKKLNAPEDLIDPVIDAMNSIGERFEKTKKIGVSGDELTILKSNIGPLITFYNDQSNYDVVNAAMNTLKMIQKNDKETLTAAS